MFPCEKQFRRIWYRKIFVLLNNNAAAVGGGSVQSGSPLHLLLEVTSTRISFERAWLGSVLHCCCTAPPAFGQQEEGSCRELVLPQRSWSKVVKMIKTILVALVSISAIAEAGRIRRDTDECDKITVAHKECVKTWVSSFDFAPPKRLSYYILNWSFTSIRGLKITQNLFASTFAIKAVSSTPKCPGSFCLWQCTYSLMFNRK